MFINAVTSDGWLGKHVQRRPSVNWGGRGNVYQEQSLIFSGSSLVMENNAHYLFMPVFIHKFSNGFSTCYVFPLFILYLKNGISKYSKTP